MKGGLVAALVMVAVSSAHASEAPRYTFGSAAEQGAFVLDTQTGRVWRYDRVDDAWYLYDLEALVRTPRNESQGRSNREDRAPTEPRPAQ